MSVNLGKTYKNKDQYHCKLPIICHIRPTALYKNILCKFLIIISNRKHSLQVFYCHKSKRKILLHSMKRVFFKPRHLRLRNPYIFSHLHLRLPLKKPQRNNLPLPVVKPLHSLTQRNILNPVLLPALLVAYLIHHIKRIAPLSIYRLIQTHRILYRVKRIDNILLRYTYLLRNLHNSRLPQILLRKTLLSINRLVRRILQRTAHPDRIARIPQKPADLADDHRYECTLSRI